MKKQLLVLCMALAFCLAVTAQTYKIDTTTISYENRQRPAFAVRYDASPKTVKKAWDEFFKKNYNVNVKGIGFLTNKDILTATDINLTAISDKKMNMYAAISDAPGERSELHYFMSFGYEPFIGADSFPSEFTAMKKILNDFSMDFLIDYYGSEASRITNEIRRLENNIKDNSKDIKRNTKKARKKSADVANGMQAKNTSLQMENDQSKLKIAELSKEIETVKIKQAGITRN